MKKDNFNLRKKRVRAKISGSAKRPRISVFKSNKYLHAQAIDDQSGKTIAEVNQKSLGKLESLGIKRDDVASFLGEKLAKLLIKKNIKSAVFDKSGYAYHGKIKLLADGARKGGLVF